MGSSTPPRAACFGQEQEEGVGVESEEHNDEEKQDKRPYPRRFAMDSLSLVAIHRGRSDKKDRCPIYS